MEEPIESVQESWRSFERAVVPAGAGPVQRSEMRRAFYAGAWSVLCSLRRLGEPSVTEDRGVEELEKLIVECEAFSRDTDRRSPEP